MIVLQIRSIIDFKAAICQDKTIERLFINYINALQLFLITYCIQIQMIKKYT